MAALAGAAAAVKEPKTLVEPLTIDQVATCLEA